MTHVCICSEILLRQCVSWVTETMGRDDVTETPNIFGVWGLFGLGFFPKNPKPKHTKNPINEKPLSFALCS